MHADAAAYALVSLDAAELAEFEAHLASCEFCQQEVAEFCETVADLSLLTEATPPRRLRAKVLAATQDLSQLPAVNGADGRADTVTSQIRRTSADPQTRPSGPRRAVPGWESDEPESPSVNDLELRRQRRRSRILSGLVAAMLIVAVGLGGVIYTLRSEEHTSELQSRQYLVCRLLLEKKKQ